MTWEALLRMKAHEENKSRKEKIDIEEGETE